MTKKEQINALAGAIKQMEVQLFLQKQEERFWHIQSLGSKTYDSVLGMTQTKVRILENQLPFYRNTLNELEQDKYIYEEISKRK